ncbi:hypothetical protein [Nostoc sp.]
MITTDVTLKAITNKSFATRRTRVPNPKSKIQNGITYPAERLCLRFV